MSKHSDANAGLDAATLETLLAKPGSGVLLNHPSTDEGTLSVGRALRSLLVGETHSFSALVGYFHHQSGQEESGNHDDPASIVLAEATEEASSMGIWEGTHCAFRLQCGALCSDSAALAARLWYWTCRWKANEPGAAGSFREAFVVRAAERTREGAPFARSCEELLDPATGPESLDGPVQRGEAFAMSLPLLEGEDRADVVHAWRTLLGLLGHAPLPSSHEGMQPFTGARATLRTAAAVLFGFLLQRRGDFKVAPQRSPTSDGRGKVMTFHPKLYVVEQAAPSMRTACIVGSSNWSRSALGFRRGFDSVVVGNVELSTLHTATGHLWSAPSPSNPGSLANEVCEAGRFIFDNTGEWIGSWAVDQQLPDVKRVHEVLTVVEKLDGWIPPSDQPPAPPKRSALDECTPVEKAWLVLHDLIGRQIGSSARATLHSEALKYQTAHYQRSAARRLKHTLDHFGGAMLCDGTGLGKTYVATTLIVHYVNQWRQSPEDWRASSSGTDPFRVTVLAPNSVVATWQAEAISPLEERGVTPAWVRVLSHSALSRVQPTSAILKSKRGGLSDLEHLLLSDLVIVDEAHNFRSPTAQRTVLLRELLRLQPRKPISRRVLLLSATPVNNSLEDLRQQASLMFSAPRYFEHRESKLQYAEITPAAAAKRVRQARAAADADVASVLAFGAARRRFSTAIDWVDNERNPIPSRLNDYFKQQATTLAEQQQALREAVQSDDGGIPPVVRVAEEFLDSVVVQRSRERCRQIEQEHRADVDILFREPAGAPIRCEYADEYGTTKEVLEKFLPLFGTEDSDGLTLKVHMWAEVRDGDAAADESTSVVALQRMLALKRLESSPVAFIISLVRMLALHATRLIGLAERYRACDRVEDEAALYAMLAKRFAELNNQDLQRLDYLVAGQSNASDLPSRLQAWRSAAPKAGTSEDLSSVEQLARLHGLRDTLLSDFTLLLDAAPRLAEVVFGDLPLAEWPSNVVDTRTETVWPDSASWGLRIVTDAKLRALVPQLMNAAANSQKALVFSQFKDTLGYIESVFRAVRRLDAGAWTSAARETPGGAPKLQSLNRLVEVCGFVRGDTTDGAAVVDAFAPFYRLGPKRPAGHAGGSGTGVSERWREGWTRAMSNPINVLFATDVLAEGVNLQDASLLVNFDIHWNPVRMIQRAGRIDRRLKEEIERALSFPDLEVLAAELNCAPPEYWWHAHRRAAPQTVNLLLPAALESEIALRERIANKTIAIDLTLGLERGTGAEADWMEGYRFRGIKALKAWSQERAVEQLAGLQETLRVLLAERRIDPAWASDWNGWLVELGAGEDAPIVATATLGRAGHETARHTRFLTPTLAEGIPHWLWTPLRPKQSALNSWLALDGKVFPAPSRTDLGWSEDASRPLSAGDLLVAAMRLVGSGVELMERGREIGKLVKQGAPAISAGFLRTAQHRRAVKIEHFQIIQLASLTAPSAAPATEES